MTTLTLSPAGRRLEVADQRPLREVLFEAGVEFPCGGRGRCKGCRVKVLRGALSPTPDDLAAFDGEAIAQGWRLACRHKVCGDLELELAQWEMTVLGDESAFAFVPREGLGIAVDLGTTTIAAQLLDLSSGNVLAVETALNDQARHGADILSRAEFALNGGQGELQRLIREQIGAMAARLLANAAGPAKIVLVGNSVMHHLFCGIAIDPLTTHPFAPDHPEAMRFNAAELGWTMQGDVTFLPCIGGLVGSDILAGVIATGLADREALTALVDLGTNGEVVVAKGGRLLCTSTAAGPAFEGARISQGMRAATGAISDVTVVGDDVSCGVIGGGSPCGLCGSGLVDAVAAGLQTGVIESNGRMAKPWTLADDVTLTPWDVRELQLAKAAIAAGLRILTERFEEKVADIAELHLAGAFGNSINRLSAHRIGLLRLPPERIRPAGNTALKGAKLALFAEPESWNEMARKIEHVALKDDPAFEDAFVEEMKF